jgi:hypothetical protein
MVVVPTEGDGKLAFPSLWVLMSASPTQLEIPAIAERAFPMKDYTTDVPLWTDDFSNLFQILR